MSVTSSSLLRSEKSGVLGNLPASLPASPEGFSSPAFFPVPVTKPFFVYNSAIFLCTSACEGSMSIMTLQTPIAFVIKPCVMNASAASLYASMASLFLPIFLYISPIRSDILGSLPAYDFMLSYASMASFNLPLEK